jgi:hypothetical protein
MSAKKVINIPPIALTTTLTTNLLNCAITSLSGPVGMTASQLFLLITKARVVNKTASPQTCSFWKGATGANAAGTEVWAQGLSIPANQFVDVHYGEMRMDAADFLVGGANANTALTLEIEAEVGVSG